MAPGRHPLGALWDATTGTAQLDAARQAGRSLGIETTILRYRDAAEMDKALQLDSAQRIQSLVVLSSPIASSGSARLAKFASRRRIPAISPFRAFAERGGLLSYGPNLRMFRRYSADYVDRICAARVPRICRSSSRPPSSSW